MNRTTTAVRAIIYLRLSDLREEDLDDTGAIRSMGAREAKLREKAKQLGWTVVKVVVENDVVTKAAKARKDGKPRKARGASAFKRVKRPDGRLGVWRPGFQAILEDFRHGRANGLLAEDLDRTMRDPRDLEDLIDIAEEKKINARSLSGSLTFTDGGTDSEITMARLMVTIANKSSRDTSRRVSEARERQAASGRYGGGRRPFGFEADGVTPRPDECEVIADSARRLLQGASLRSLALELRQNEAPTVTGAPWSSATLRDVLLRPRNAGKMVLRGEVVGDASWQPIVPWDVHLEVQRLLTDPGRRVTPGTAPRWLGSGIYRCGACDDDTICYVTITGRAPRYRCSRSSHVTRNGAGVDALVVSTVLELCQRPDVVARFAAARPDVDVAALRAERDAITANVNELAADKAMGLIDRAQLIAGTERGRKRQTQIDELLKAAAVESPVARLLGASDIDAAWDAEPLSAQRAILQELMVVTILPSTRPGSRTFDPSSVDIKPR